MAWPCYGFVDGLPHNALMCIKKVKLINHDCLPILMLLYIMLYIVLAYLMLYIVLAYQMLFVCIMLLLPMISAIAFYFHVFLCVLVY